MNNFNIKNQKSYMISLTDEEKLNYGDRCLNDYTKIDLLGKYFSRKN